MLVRTSHRMGFTIIELLVVMTILGILVALAVPAVQMTRASAQRVACGNQLRQLGLATLAYHDLHTTFPAGSYVMGSAFPMQSGWGWGAMILPMLDQGNAYSQIDFGKGTAVENNLNVIIRHLPPWRCPSEISPESIIVQTSDHPPFRLPAENYCGAEEVLSGMSTVRIADIRDGTTQTLMLGERMVQSGLDKSLPFVSAWCGQVAFAECYEYRSVPHLAVTGLHPINAAAGDPLCFGSWHSGGANFSLADGSLKFLSATMDRATFEAMGTIAKGDRAVVP